MSPCVIDGSLLGRSHPVFDLGEGLLDRVEVGRIWRQIPEPGACGADHLTDSGRLVGAEIDGVDAPSRHRCAKVVSLIIT